VPSLRANLLANFAGQGWVAILQLIFLPIYVHLLGVEAYGLIGFFLMMQTMLRVLDFGLGHTLNREMARYSIAPEKAGEARDFLRTAEIVYWVIGSGVGAAVWLLAPLIASSMITARDLSSDTVSGAIGVMGLVLALQWPMAAYMGALLGLQEQVALNIIKIVFATASSAGGALLLWLVSGGIELFFWWQLLVALVGLLVSIWLVWRILPPAIRRARFEWKLLQRNWRFAAGITGITITAIVLTQGDKWILVNLVDLKTFGYYTIGGTVAAAVYLLVTPIFNTVYPRYAALAAAKDESALARQYHLGAQLMASLLLPTGLLLGFFSQEILVIWTHNPEIAQRAAMVVTMLVLGNTMNGLMNLPYALQLAYGWTALALRINLALTAIFLPLVYYCTVLYSMPGAAFAWAAVSALYLVIGVPLTHRRLLVHEQIKWWVRDAFVPLLSALAILVVTRIIVRPDWGPWPTLAALCVALASAIVLSAITCRDLRQAVIAHLRPIVLRSLKTSRNSGSS